MQQLFAFLYSAERQVIIDFQRVEVCPQSYCSWKS